MVFDPLSKILGRKITVEKKITLDKWTKNNSKKENFKLFDSIYKEIKQQYPNLNEKNTNQRAKLVLLTQREVKRRGYYPQSYDTDSMVKEEFFKKYGYELNI